MSDYSSKCSGDVVNSINDYDAGMKGIRGQPRVLCQGGTSRLCGITQGSAGGLLEESDSKLSLEE